MERQSREITAAAAAVFKTNVEPRSTNISKNEQRRTVEFRVWYFGDVPVHENLRVGFA